MPEVVAIKCENFDFVIWTKDISVSQKRLEATLDSRGKNATPSCLLLSPPLILDQNPKAVSQYDINSSVFFENKQYDIEFVFDESLKSEFSHNPPFVEHRLKAVEDSFHYSSRSNSLRATINTGNDIGWFKFELVYQVDQEQLRQSFAFEVLPTKMDMASDLDVINVAIDSQFPLWRFALAEKTQQQMQAVKKPHSQFLLLWLAQFESLLDELQGGLRHIVNAPHSRLMSTSRSVKMNRLKGKLSQKLEQNIMLAKASGDIDKRFQLNNKKLSVDTPENRFIKSVILTSILKLTKIHAAAKKMETNPDKLRLSDSFFGKLEQWQKDMRFFQRQPLFREVGTFKGLKRESLVLQQKAGYAKVYKIWQQLKWYLDLLEGDSSLSIRSISELYEVWCFLEVRRILLDLGFEEVVNNRTAMINSGVDVAFEDGMAGSFKLKRKDGIFLRLAHEPTFLPEGKPIKSWITTQKPDIFLEASFPNGEKFVWLFDAKYRIKKLRSFQGSTDSLLDGLHDEVPDDAINQMHRYRDALIHQDITSDGDSVKARPVFGAYALYPGFFNQREEKNPYQSAIDEVGIGAFSLLPASNHEGSVWLTKFLSDKLKIKTVSFDKASPEKYYVEEAPRIPYQGTNVSRYNDLVIAANQLGPSRDREYIRDFELGNAAFYHTRQLAFDRQNIEFHIIKEARYLAVAVDSAEEGNRKISFIYPILNVKKLRREEITFKQSGTNKVADPDELYWLFELGKSFVLNQPISLIADSHFQLKLVGREDISAGKTWTSLEERYTTALFNSLD